MLEICEKVTNVFISHAVEDHSTAIDLKKLLENEGISCWCFEEDLPHGSHIANEVKRAINEADFLIILLSRHSVSSEWVRRELGCAREIHLRKGRGRRPIIIPVTESGFDGLEKDFQPISFDSLKPLGEPIRFTEHNCFTLSEITPFDTLVRQLLPRITRITSPFGMHADLFASIIQLWRDLFPDCGDVPDDFDVANWLETESEMGKSCPWSDTLLAFHYGIEVTAFVYMSFFKNEIHGYGTFIGIDPDWRPKTTFSWVAKRIIEEIASSHPQCQGIFFDVNEVDAQGIEEAAKDDFQDAPTEWIKEQSQRLLRINHFINNGARLLVSGGSPARIIQPSLREPLEIANERSHYLMYWPARNGGYPSDIKSLVRTYYNSYLIGFGPDGTSIPGYEMYLDDAQSRTVENISEKSRFEKFFITGAMKKLIRISRSLR